MRGSASIRQLGIDVIERESVAVASVAGQLDAGFEAVVQELLECKGKVLVSGSGTSHAVALRFAHLLSCVGIPALFLHPGDSQHGASGAVAAGDVWVGLSKGGEEQVADFTAKRTPRELGQVPHQALHEGPYGPLQTFKGSQKYTVPATINITEYKSVVIWNAFFGFLVSPADLKFL